MICKKCGKEFPSSILIGNKRKVYSSRKYCLVCSPPDEHNTKKLHITKIKNVNGAPFVDIILECKICTRKYTYNRKNGCTMEKCNSCMTAAKRKIFKSECIKYLGGKCAICGFNLCNSALNFHHLDPNKKDFNICNASSIASLSRTKEELDKCILVCGNCHSEIHYGIISDEKIQNILNGYAS